MCRVMSSALVSVENKRSNRSKEDLGFYPSRQTNCSLFSRRLGTADLNQVHSSDHHAGKQS